MGSMIFKFSASYRSFRVHHQYSSRRISVENNVPPNRFHQRFPREFLVRILMW